MQLHVLNDDLSSVLACLGIGLLWTIRQGVIPPESGIWTLARPQTWVPLQDVELVPQEIIDVFQACDELSAIKKLVPDHYEEAIDEFIQRLAAVMAPVGTIGWQLSWVHDDVASKPNE